MYSILFILFLVCQSVYPDRIQRIGTHLVSTNTTSTSTTTSGVKSAFQSDRLPPIRSVQTINLNFVQFRSVDKNERRRFKHYSSQNYWRRRRRSTENSSNLASGRSNEDLMIPLSLKYQPTEAQNKEFRQKLRNKNISQILNSSQYLSNENFTDYNTTNQSFVELPPSLKVFFYCVYTLIFFVGLIGNSLNIYVVFSNKSMYNVTYFFITNLAMSDRLLCLFSVPITPMYLLFYKHWPFDDTFGKLLCHLLPFSQGVSVYVSAFTLMSIAVDRYFVIIFPFKKRMSVRMCVCIIIIIWISGSTLTLPYAIFMKLLEVEDDRGRKLRFCEEAWPHDASRRTFSTCTSVIQFVVPFVIIAFCYSKVCSKLKTRAKFKPGAKSARKEELERERSRRTNRMLIAMVIIFGLAWLPLNVHNLVVDFYDSANNWPYIRCFFLLAHAIAMSCTCYNFCLYAYLNDHFKKNFKAVLPCFDVPFFYQRMRNDAQNNQANTANMVTLKTPDAAVGLEATSTVPLTKELLTKTEQSTKQINLTEYIQSDPHTNNNNNNNV